MSNFREFRNLSTCRVLQTRWPAVKLLENIVTRSPNIAQCNVFRAFKPERRFYSSCLPVAVVVDATHRTEKIRPLTGGGTLQANQSPYSGTNNKTSKGTATERCTLRLTRPGLDGWMVSFGFGMTVNGFRLI